MMNMTVEEEKTLNPRPKITYIKRIYRKPKFLCKENHELAMVYQRFTSTSSIKRVPEYFYCEKCKKMYTKSGDEIGKS